MKIHRGGKVIYDNETDGEYPPELIKGDTVTREDYESFLPSSRVVYDVISVGDADKPGTKLSQVCPGIAFEVK